MTGYCLLNEMLLKPLTRSPYSIHIDDLCVSCPAYADDLTIIAISVRALQELLNIVYDFSCKWRLQFNPKKCKIIVYGNDRMDHKDFTLGSDIIERCKAHIHVGTTMYPSSSEVSKYVRDKINKCKMIAYSIHAIGSRNAPVTPISGSFVYKSICLSKLLYGSEMLAYSNTVIMELESYQALVAKYWCNMQNWLIKN